MQVFPTLLEVAGLPPNPANEGHSLLPLVKHPTDPAVLAKFNVSYSQVCRAITLLRQLPFQNAIFSVHLLHTDMRMVCS